MVAVAWRRVGLAFVPLGGRTLERWAPVAARFGARRPPAATGGPRQRDMHGGGGSFVDPWEWYAAGVGDGPLSHHGREGGVREERDAESVLSSPARVRRQAWFLDPRGEYDKLCAAVGVSPVHLRPGGAARLNPLAPRVGGDEHPHDLRGRLAPAGEDRDDGVKRILVVDEAWKVLTRLEVARWLQENWKLTRSTAVHRSIADAIAATVVP